MDQFRRILDGRPLPDELRGGVVAIGNFDGVHRGHQAVLERALREAQRRGVPALALTFEPHPRKLFRPEVPLFVLTQPPMKARLIAALGFSALVEQAFTPDFASRTADEFVTRMLTERLGISHAVTGFDFHFGKGREGGPAFLMAAGERQGFSVTLVDPFRDEGGEIVSSSRIRSLLAQGEVAEAAGLLGYRYTVEADVVSGRQLGRTLGYPTANMVLPLECELKHGIYAVRLRDGEGRLRDGVASFGRRPTVEKDGEPLLETFVFDFAGDLYGQTCSVSLFGFLRGEQKFDGLDVLTAQMHRDEEEARAMLASAQPLSALDSAVAW